MRNVTSNSAKTAIGLDVSDHYIQVCVLDERGEIVEEGRVRTSPDAVRRRFNSVEPARIALEVGTHSPWLSRLLAELGHEVFVANARKLRGIYENDRKSAVRPEGRPLLSGHSGAGIRRSLFVWEWRLLAAFSFSRTAPAFAVGMRGVRFRERRARSAARRRSASARFCARERRSEACARIPVGT